LKLACSSNLVNMAKVDPGEFSVSVRHFLCVSFIRLLVYKLVYFAVVFKFGTGLTIVIISVL
jgi:hypothetical protein